MVKANSFRWLVVGLLAMTGVLPSSYGQDEGRRRWFSPLLHRKRNHFVVIEETVPAGPLTAAEVRKTAEEGFIYGLPIVMNYAVQYSYCVDKNSGQYKGPFNTIANEARVFTYKDTAIITPNSDTPYSLLWLDLRTEPMIISVPAVEKS